MFELFHMQTVISVQQTIRVVTTELVSTSMDRKRWSVNAGPDIPVNIAKLTRVLHVI